MTRLFLASIAVVSALAVVPCTGEAQKSTPKKGDLPESNQVYVKLILPNDPATRDKDRPVVESWIAARVNGAVTGCGVGFIKGFPQATKVWSQALSERPTRLARACREDRSRIPLDASSPRRVRHQRADDLASRP
jgi:hypothetical protein